MDVIEHVEDEARREFKIMYMDALLASRYLTMLIRQAE